MKLKNLLYILFQLLFALNVISANQNIDSLRRVFKTNPTDTNGINALLLLSQNFYLTNLDSVYHYNIILKDICLKNLSENKSLSRREKYVNIYCLSGSYSHISIYFMEIGDYKKSIDFANESIKWWAYALKNYKFEQGKNIYSSLTSAYSNLGSSYDYIGNYPRAIESYMKSLQIITFLKNEKDSLFIEKVLMSEAITVYNLAMVFKNINDVYKTEKTYKKALDLFENLTRLNDVAVIRTGFLGKANTLSDLGSIYLNDKKYEKSLSSYLMSKNILDSLNSVSNNMYLYEYAHVITQMGIYHKRLKQYNEALQLYNEGLEIRRLKGNPRYISISLNNISSLYYEMGKYNESLNASLESWKWAVESNAPIQKSKAAEGIADAYEKLGDYKKGIEWFKTFKNITDSLNNEEKINQTKRIEAQYENDKKEFEITILNNEKALADLTIANQNAKLDKTNYQIIGLILGLLLLFVLFLFVVVVIKQRHKRILKEKLLEEEKLRLKFVIEMQEKERTRIARDLHDGVGQLLSAASINFDMLNKENASLINNERYDSSMKILNDACSELRSISHEMMPRSLTDQGLIVAIQELITRTFNNTSISVSFENFGINERLPVAIENTFFRICQELLGNIIKHSNATNVQIQLYKTSDSLILQVEDNGNGIKNKEDKAGIGLHNIIARVSVFNGSFSIENGPEKGVVAIAKIPDYAKN